MIKRILFATGFSENDAQAALRVIEIAKAFDATVDIVHAIEPLAADPADDGFDDLYFSFEKRANEQIARLAQTFRDEGVQCSTSITVEHRARAIVERADAENVDLIIIGSRGHANGRKVGSTGHLVFLEAHRPLLVLREAGLR